MGQATNNATSPVCREIPFLARVELNEVIGEGRYSKIYRAWDSCSNRELAVKVVDLEDGSHGGRMLSNEFDVLSRVRHPYIVESYDFGFSKDKSWAAMTTEYVPGISISEINSRVSWPQLCSLLWQACQGLDVLHRRGWIHGDVKPDHLIVDDTTASTAKWIDMGMAQHVSAIAPEYLGGTSAYIAPEVRDGRVDYRSDVYSLGVMVYELMADRFPGSSIRFDPENIHDAVGDLKNAGLPEKFAEIVLSMTAWAPGDRCSARALAEVCGEELSVPPTLLFDEPFPRVIGRNHLISDFRELLTELMDNRSSQQSWLLTGEAGIGKSRLMDEFRVMAKRAGCICLSVKFRHGTNDAYGPIHAALDVFEEVETRNSRSDDVYSGEDAIHTRREEFVSRIRRVSGGFPVVLMMENLHLAEPEVVALWGVIVRSLSDRRVFVCGSREERECIELDALAAELERSQRVMIRSLNRMSLAENTALVCEFLRDDAVDGVVAESLWRKSGGNPLYLRLLLSQCRDRTRQCSWRNLAAALEGLTDATDLSQIVLQKLEGLSETELKVLQGLAVFGRAADCEEINAVLDLDYVDVEIAVRHLHEKSLLKANTSRRGLFEFVHSEVEFCIYGSLDERARQRLHLGLAKVLESRGPVDGEMKIDELARHFILARELDQATKYGLMAANNKMADFACHSAARLFKDVLEFMDEGHEAYPETVESYTLALSWTDQLPDPIPNYVSLLKRKLTDTLRANILRRLGERYSSANQFDDADRCISSAYTLLSARPECVAMARLESTRIRSIGQRGQAAEAKRLGLESLDRLNQLDPATKGYRFEALGRVCVALGEIHEAAKWYQSARIDFQRTKNSQSVARVTLSLSRCAYMLDDYTRALKYNDEALRILEQLGDSRSTAAALTVSASIRYTMGDLHGAEALGLRASELYLAVGRDVAGAMARVGVTWSQIKMGRYHAARDSIAAARKVFHLQDYTRRFETCIVDAMCALNTGHVKNAGAMIRDMERMLPEFTIRPERLLILAHLKGRYLDAIGATDEARKTLEDALREATSLGLLRVEAELQIELAMLQPSSDQAQEYAEVALRTAAQLRHGVIDCEAKLALGLVLHTKGRIEDAADMFTECVKMARANGMKDICWQADEMLSDCQQILGRERYAYLYMRESRIVRESLRGQFEGSYDWENYLRTKGDSAVALASGGLV